MRGRGLHVPQPRAAVPHTSPGETPETGQMAVRVITHYRDELPNVFVV